MVLKARSLAEVYASGRPIICCKEGGERVWAPAGGVGQCGRCGAKIVVVSGEGDGTTEARLNTMEKKIEGR